MALRFIKTSILTSSDGIDFADETAVESEEVVRARVAAEVAQNKPLYQQLAELKEKKLEEYNENTKKIFAPPKALDAEDAQFLNDLEDSKARVKLAHKQQDTAAIEAFRDARKIDSLNVKGATAPTINFSKLKKPHNEPSVKFNVKRKISDMANPKSEPSVEDFGSGEKLPPSLSLSQEGDRNCPVVVRPSVELLCAYGSDSD